MDQEDKSITGFETALLEENAYTLMDRNPAFREACLCYEVDLIGQWKGSKAEENEVRERLYSKLCVLTEVLAELDNLYVEYEARLTAK